MKFNIIYGKEQRIDSLFWKEFLRAVGIWINTYSVDVCRKKKIGGNNICFLSEGENLERVSDNDLIISNDNCGFHEQNNDNFNGYLSVLENICYKFGFSSLEQEELINLLKVFYEEKIWYVSWIIQEFPKFPIKINEMSDNLITFINNSLEKIENHRKSNYKENQYTRFFYHYLDYLSFCCVDKKSSIKKVEHSGVAVKNIQNYFKIEDLHKFYPRYGELAGDFSYLEHRRIEYYEATRNLGINSSVIDCECAKFFHSEFFENTSKNKDIFNHATMLYESSIELNDENFEAKYGLSQIILRRAEDFPFSLTLLSQNWKYLEPIVMDVENLTSLAPLEYALRTLMLEKRGSIAYIVGYSKGYLIDKAIEELENKVADGKLYENLLNTMLCESNRGLYNEDVIIDYSKDKAKELCQYVKKLK